jgi:hypothetical protein
VRQSSVHNRPNKSEVLWRNKTDFFSQVRLAENLKKHRHTEDFDGFWRSEVCPFQMQALQAAVNWAAVYLTCRSAAASGRGTQGTVDKVLFVSLCRAISPTPQSDYIQLIGGVQGLDNRLKGRVQMLPLEQIGAGEEQGEFNIRLRSIKGAVEAESVSAIQCIQASCFAIQREVTAMGIPPTEFHAPIQEFRDFLCKCAASGSAFTYKKAKGRGPKWSSLVVVVQ